MHKDVNQILKVYLGAGPEGGYQPIDHEGRMRRAFPADHEQQVMHIKRYLDEVRIPPKSAGDSA
jgi:hypothetical protein